MLFWVISMNWANQNTDSSIWASPLSSRAFKFISWLSPVGGIGRTWDVKRQLNGLWVKVFFFVENDLPPSLTQPCKHPGRSGGIVPRADPSSTGSYELPSPYTCCSSCCWFWPAWCLCPKRTTAAHCPTTSPAPSTPCCVTPTAPRPHEHGHDAQQWSSKTPSPFHKRSTSSYCFLTKLYRCI